MKPTKQTTEVVIDAEESEAGIPVQRLSRAQLGQLAMKYTEGGICPRDVGILNLEWVSDVIDEVCRQFIEEKGCRCQRYVMTAYIMTMVRFNGADFVYPNQFAHEVRQKLNEIGKFKFEEIERFMAICTDYSATNGIKDILMGVDIDAIAANEEG